MNPLYKYAAYLAIVVLWTAGNRWQAVQALKHEYSIEQIQRDATAQESKRISEKAAAQAKANYETQLETIKRNAPNYRGADRLRNARPADSSSCNPTTPAGAPTAPKLEWLN